MCLHFKKTISFKGGQWWAVQSSQLLKLLWMQWKLHCLKQQGRHYFRILCRVLRSRMKITQIKFYTKVRWIFLIKTFLNSVMQQLIIYSTHNSSNQVGIVMHPCLSRARPVPIEQAEWSCRQLYSNKEASSVTCLRNRSNRPKLHQI